ncbi:MAG TPA: bifunctional phosphoribosylaminoimidazolecarboxamide formyltransferase/IMP cyclohydrolase [bacterium]|jgi:phosphoribosylaminoimidazolecarboxamide formyltransferase/IMP cyclohydrolase|nr:bifunctional phosphoribosylaminoimidazolecarboxamide formyltransferase/IMP cyclohydrolase [bacterium]
MKEVSYQAPGPRPQAQIRRALLSVWDKTGLAELARALADAGVELFATSGTAQILREQSLVVRSIEDLTGFPEVLGGRVKTLHPAVFAGILARDDPAHRHDLDVHGLEPIDLVIVNLYPFEAKTAAGGLPEEEALELIDIGGVSLLRAAAKNWKRVTVLSDASQYPEFIAHLHDELGMTAAMRRRLAVEAFRRTAAYDAAIAGYFDGPVPLAGLGHGAGGTPQALPARLSLAFQRRQEMRYGENPHQRAAFYAGQPAWAGTIAAARQIQGKELSFNNIVDIDAAWGAVGEFERPAAVIVKHATPCGAAIADGLRSAYEAARACDPTSAFGGVVAVNVRLDEATAQAMLGIFTEAVIAPAYDPAALAILARRPNLRVLDAGARPRRDPFEVKSVSGGLLMQEADGSRLIEDQLKVVTDRAPSPQELADLLFAWRVAKWVKSNAIVLAGGGATVGIGAGQPNRVGAVDIAVKVAGERARGSVLASDAFFPFRDGIDAAARAGVTAVIQPGGSVRDAEVIAAAREYGLAMVFTGIRHFRH